MTQQRQERRRVVAGVDAHTDEHHAAVLDQRGRLLATAAFPATRDGYRALLRWLEGYGKIDRVGIESTGSFASALTRELAHQGIQVIEVNQPHPHTRARHGKSDPLDAELAAKAVLSGQATAAAKDTTGIVEAIRQLALVRASAVKARTAALNQLESLAITAPDELRAHLATRTTLKGKASLSLTLRPDATRLGEPLQAAKHSLRSLARRIRDLNQEINELDTRLQQLVPTAAPHTTSLLGVGVIHTSQLLVTAGQNIDRLRNEASFAKLCAAAPIPASSGRTTRHRLNPNGDRQANRALHLIAISRLRHCQRTRAYANRRTTEGLSKRDIIRCLKRYIAREIYHTLQTDLAALTHT